MVYHKYNCSYAWQYKIYKKSGEQMFTASWNYHY